MALTRYNTDLPLLAIADYVQGGTRIKRRAQVTEFYHRGEAQFFAVGVKLFYYAVGENGSYGDQLPEQVAGPQDDTLKANMLRLVDQRGRIVAVRGADDAAWAALLAQYAADESKNVSYQYELFRQWCRQPQVIDNLIEGFIYQAYGTPA